MRKQKYLSNRLVLLTVLICLCFAESFGQTQKVNIPLSSPGKAGKLKLHLINGSIEVIGYNGKEVEIEVISRKKQQNGKKETKNGLKRIASNNLSFSAEEIENTIIIKRNDWNNTADFKIKVPTNFSLDLRALNDGDIYVENVSGEFEVSNVNGAITMQDISGSVVADALNEDVKVSFKSVSAGEAMAFSSLNGDLEITFPASLKANITAKTENGDLYTDFEMDLSNNQNEVKKERSNGKYKVSYESDIRGKINGGGAEFTFKAFNGDILIRKK